MASTRPLAEAPARADDHVAPEWGWAWPANRRLLYNRASADPDGQAMVGAQALRVVGRRRGKWTGDDVPDFKADTAPDHQPEEGATGADALAGDQPFIMQDDGVAWLYVPTGLKDGPFPTHYEPHESPVRNPLYGQECNPARERYARPENPYQPSDGQPGADPLPLRHDDLPADRAPHRRRHEPHRAHLAELQPEMFCEVSPALAAERGLENGGWATIVSARTAIEARVLVTDRIPPLTVGGRRGAPGRAPVPLGLSPAWPPATPPTTCARGARPQRPHPGGQGGHLRHRRRPAARGAELRALRRRPPGRG